MSGVDTALENNAGQCGATRLKDCRHGRMLYLHRDVYVGRSLDVYGEFSELESRLFASIVRPGDAVIEVGANIGAHTVYLAQLAGPGGTVIAFEPQRVIFQILCANLALNEHFHVRTFHAAAGREPGQLQVPAFDYSRANNFGACALPCVTTGEAVPVMALDSLTLPSPRLLKIDVEGMEADVLLGARQLIATHQPVIYLENDRRERSPELIGILQDFGYNIWWHLPFLFNKDNFAGNPDNIFGGTGSANMLCITKQVPIKITGLTRVCGVNDWYE